MPRATLYATCQSMLRAEETVELSAAEIEAVHKRDTLTLQSYGRPCASSRPLRTQPPALYNRSQLCYLYDRSAVLATHTVVAVGLFILCAGACAGTTLVGSPLARTTPMRKGRRWPSLQNGPIQSLRPSSADRPRQTVLQVLAVGVASDTGSKQGTSHDARRWWALFSALTGSRSVGLGLGCGPSRPPAAALATGTWAVSALSMRPASGPAALGATCHSGLGDSAPRLSLVRAV